MVSLKINIITAEAAPSPVIKFKKAIPVRIAIAEKMPITHAKIMKT